MRTFMMTALILLAGCAVKGSKSTLSPSDGSHWRTTSHGYTFSQNGVSISIKEIVLSHNISSFGPIFPIIPSGKEVTYELEALTVSIDAYGYTHSENPDIDLIRVESNISGITVTLEQVAASVITEESKKQPGMYWANIWTKYSGDYTLGEISQLNINIELPMFKTSIPELKLQLSEQSDNKFILHMGP